MNGLKNCPAVKVLACEEQDRRGQDWQIVCYKQNASQILTWSAHTRLYATTLRLTHAQSGRKLDGANESGVRWQVRTALARGDPPGASLCGRHRREPYADGLRPLVLLSLWRSNMLCRWLGGFKVFSLLLGIVMYFSLPLSSALVGPEAYRYLGTWPNAGGCVARRLANGGFLALRVG